MNKGELLGIAIKIAVDAHAGTFDRGGNPYILHPLAVMQMLADTKDEELQAIGVLHDVVEDNKKYTYAYLREMGMTDLVIAGVRALTKIPGETLDEYKDRVFSNYDSMRAKQKDLLHNSDLRRLKGIRDKDIERNAQYQIFYYQIEQRIASGQYSV